MGLGRIKVKALPSTTKAEEGGLAPASRELPRARWSCGEAGLFAGSPGPCPLPPLPAWSDAFVVMAIAAAPSLPYCGTTFIGVGLFAGSPRLHPPPPLLAWSDAFAVMTVASRSIPTVLRHHFHRSWAVSCITRTASAATIASLVRCVRCHDRHCRSISTVLRLHFLRSAERQHLRRTICHFD